MRFFAFFMLVFLSCQSAHQSSTPQGVPTDPAPDPAIMVPGFGSPHGVCIETCNGNQINCRDFVISEETCNELKFASRVRCPTSRNFAVYGPRVVSCDKETKVMRDTFNCENLENNPNYAIDLGWQEGAIHPDPTIEGMEPASIFFKVKAIAEPEMAKWLKNDGTPDQRKSGALTHSCQGTFIEDMTDFKVSVFENLILVQEMREKDKNLVVTETILFQRSSL